MEEKATRPGMVDYLEPEFLHALGIAIATFALIESLMRNAYFFALHGGVDAAAHPETVIEIHECKFSARIDKVFKVIRRKVARFEERGFGELQQDFHTVRIARNFVAHGVWLRTENAGEYKVSFIDDAGRVITQPVTKESILETVGFADNLMVKLKSLLVAEGLFPPIGPRI